MASVPESNTSLIPESSTALISSNMTMQEPNEWELCQAILHKLEGLDKIRSDLDAFSTSVSNFGQQLERISTHYETLDESLKKLDSLNDGLNDNLERLDNKFEALVQGMVDTFLPGDSQNEMTTERFNEVGPEVQKTAEMLKKIERNVQRNNIIHAVILVCFSFLFFIFFFKWVFVQ